MTTKIFQINSFRMIHIGTLFFVFLLGVALFLGMAIVWQIRGKRIAALESILNTLQQEKLHLEMEKGNLEEFINHWKAVGANRKQSKSKSKNSTNSTNLRQYER